MSNTMATPHGPVEVPSEWTCLAILEDVPVRCVEVSTATGAMWSVEGHGGILYHRTSFGAGIWALPDELKVGLHIKCGNCGKPITKPGALLVYIGPPDKDGNFTGHKEHACLECDDENNARGVAEYTPLKVHWTHVAMIEGKKVRVRKSSDGVWEAEGYEGQRVTMSGAIRKI